MSELESEERSEVMKHIGIGITEFIILLILLMVVSAAIARSSLKKSR